MDELTVDSWRTQEPQLDPEAWQVPCTADIAAVTNMWHMTVTQTQAFACNFRLEQSPCHSDEHPKRTAVEESKDCRRQLSYCWLLGEGHVDCQDCK